MDAHAQEKCLTLAVSTPSLLLGVRSLREAVRAIDPRIALRIARLAPREAINSMLLNASTDFAIAVSGATYDPGLEFCTYGSDELAVFYDHTVRQEVETIEDYATARHAVVDFGGQTASEVQKVLDQHNIKRNIALYAPTASMLGQLIKDTDLIATMPRALAFGVYNNLSFRPPPLNFPQITFDLVWRKDLMPSDTVRDFKELILAHRHEIHRAS